MKSILDPAFKYIPSHKTDIKRTFARIRAEMRAKAERPANVVDLDTERKMQAVEAVLRG